MKATKLQKCYSSPEIEIIKLSATDVLKQSDNSPGENIDENQGEWI